MNPEKQPIEILDLLKPLSKHNGKYTKKYADHRQKGLSHKKLKRYLKNKR